MKSRTRKDPFQIPKMEIFKSNEQFYNFYPHLPKTFFIQNEQEQSINLK